jgi:hypothetical protein
MALSALRGDFPHSHALSPGSESGNHLTPLLYYKKFLWPLVAAQRNFGHISASKHSHEARNLWGQDRRTTSSPNLPSRTPRRDQGTRLATETPTANPSEKSPIPRLLLPWPKRCISKEPQPCNSCCLAGSPLFQPQKCLPAMSGVSSREVSSLLNAQSQSSPCVHHVTCLYGGWLFRGRFYP